MTIAEIIDRERVAHFPFPNNDPRLDAFGLAVAKAVVEECAKIAKGSNFVDSPAWGTIEGQISRAIQGLAAQGPGGEAGR